jgi:hypothetical protein
LKYHFGQFGLKANPRLAKSAAVRRELASKIAISPKGTEMKSSASIPWYRLPAHNPNFSDNAILDLIYPICHKLSAAPVASDAVGNFEAGMKLKIDQLKKSEYAGPTIFTSKPQ